jgi:glycosyltransferase involved in cell wall biosynthesis
MKLSVIIPVFNEENTIREILRRVEAVDIAKEIIVVNDGSTDNTSALLKEQKMAALKVVEQPVNMGKGTAVRTGFAQATGDIVIIQDADLELDPQDYSRLIEPLLAGWTDVVYGSRYMRGRVPGQPWPNYLANRLLVLATNLLYNASLTDMETCYKVLRAEVAKGLDLRASRFEIEPEITAKLLKRGHQILEVPVSYYPRSAREGKKIKWRDGFSTLFTLLRCRLTD